MLQFLKTLLLSVIKLQICYTFSEKLFAKAVLFNTAPPEKTTFILLLIE